MTSAYLDYLDLCRRCPPEFPLEWTEDMLKRRGFYYATPSFFIMGRPVIKSAMQVLITDPSWVFDWDLCDCWYVHGMAGDIAKAWSILPWELPWIGFCRGALDPTNELRFYRTSALRRHTPHVPLRPFP